MPKLGRLDSDTAALRQRLQSHERFGSRDLNEWIFESLQPLEGAAILDLGCGTGKQAIPLAELAGPAGRVTAVDVASDALSELVARAEKARIGDRVRVVLSSLDGARPHLSGSRFDRAVGAYSLYYAEDTRALLELIHEILTPEGILFFCGPSRRNNAEIKAFHHSLRPEAPELLVEAAQFMESAAPQLCRGLFREVAVSRFENPLRFDSAEALFDYWKSYNLYDDSLVEPFREKAVRHFSRGDHFETVKRVVGIRAVK